MSSREGVQSRRFCGQRPAYFHAIASFSAPELVDLLCTTSVVGHVFPSLDGRYFGPLPLTAIVGRAEPIWTREDN